MLDLVRTTLRRSGKSAPREGTQAPVVVYDEKDRNVRERGRADVSGALANALRGE